MFGYEAYFSGSFDGSIIDNTEGKTFLPSAKENPERFEEINSGEPLFTGKIAIKNSKIGEIGLSHMGGIYNKFNNDGIIVDVERRVDVYAIDFNTTLPKIETFITGECGAVAGTAHRIKSHRAAAGFNAGHQRNRF